MSDDTEDLKHLVQALARAPAPDVRVHSPVTINQQPHDAADAARLYGELQAKARTDLVNAVRVTNAHFECVVHHYRDQASDEHVFTAIFSLNGVKMQAEARIWSREPAGKAYEQLQEKVAKEIATRIVGPAFSAAVAQGRLA